MDPLLGSACETSAHLYIYAKHGVSAHTRLTRAPREEEYGQAPQVHDELLMSELVLSVTNVSKKYCAQSRRAFWYAIYDVLGELRPRRQLSKVLRPGEYWVLRDVDLELRRGEALAVIGHNGAGKSTLLKLLFGLLKPDVGEIRIRGRTEALIELGIGFNPVLTGRENIRLSAALHGYSALRARRLLDEVSHFAGLGDCLDAPIQSYSSGMKARLSYAVAANLEPDLLLIDEVLAVGDLAFQRKCLNHMRAYLDRGGALLLVSHNTLQVQSICQRALLLERGRVLFSGSAVDALNQMFDSQLADPPQGAEAEPQIGPILIRQLTAEPLRGEGIWSGEAVRIRLIYHSQEQLDVFWGFVVYTGDQAVCVTGGLDPSQHRLTPGAGELSCVIPRLPLVGGRYVLRGTLLEAHTRHPVAAFGWKNSPTVLDVRQHPSAHANIRMTVQQLMTLDIEWSEEA